MRTAALVLLLSCADDGIRWSLPADMPADERAAFAAKCADWNRIAVRQQSIADDEGTHHVVYREPDELTNFHDEDGDGVNDYRAEAGGRWLFVRRGMRPDMFRGVVLHEQGHVLGLSRRGADGIDRHVPAPAVMSATVSSEEFSEADLAECRRVRACE